MPPSPRERRVAAVESLRDRHRVHHDERVHGVGVVERRAEGDVGTAVVPDDREALIAEPAHQGYAVSRHRTLGVRLVIRRRERL